MQEAIGCNTTRTSYNRYSDIYLQYTRLYVLFNVIFHYSKRVGNKSIYLYALQKQIQGTARSIWHKNY